MMQVERDWLIIATAPPLELVKWRLIDGWPYEVNNLGEIRRFGRIEKILPYFGTVRLSRNGEVKKHQLHRLVCAAFHGPQPLDKPLVRHLDGNVSNGFASNLAWGTATENGADRIRHGKAGQGESNPCSKYSNDLAARVNAAYAAISDLKMGARRGARKKIADEFGLTVKQVTHLTSRRRRM
jgi:hypothetical protein